MKFSSRGGEPDGGGDFPWHIPSCLPGKRAVESVALPIVRGPPSLDLN